jgi:hypothetical protein
MAQGVIDWDGWSEDTYRIDGDRWSMEQIEALATCLPRVGAASAARIAKGLGMDFFDAIEERPEALSSVTNLSTTKAWEAWEGWQFLKHIYRLPIVPMGVGLKEYGSTDYPVAPGTPQERVFQFRCNPQVAETFAMISRWLNAETPPPKRMDLRSNLMPVDVPGCEQPTLVRTCSFEFEAPFLKWTKVAVTLTMNLTIRVLVDNPSVHRWDRGNVPSIGWDARSIADIATDRIAQSRRGVRGLRDAK